VFCPGGVRPATFYDHPTKRADTSRPSDRAKFEADLKPEIERVFEENLSLYGVRKVWHQMRRVGIEDVVRGKKPRTTIPDAALPCPLGKVNRPFQAPAPKFFG